MATTSARSFNSYSGLDRQQQMQNMPSATDRLQQPDLFGAGKPGNIAMRETAPWAMGLAERGATASGRSTRDPYRALEMMSRGTARPGQVQAALGLRQLRMQDQDPIDAAREQQFGAQGNNVSGENAAFQQRQDNITAAMGNGTFGAIQQRFNRQGAPFGHSMDQFGNIFRANNQSPSVRATQSGISSAMRSRAPWER